MLRRAGNLTGPLSIRAGGARERPPVDLDPAELNTGRIINALWRAKWLIAGLSFIAFVASGLYAYRIAVPVYTATTQLVLDGRQETVTDLDSVVSGLATDQVTINTQLEVMRSRMLIGKLVDALDLTAVVEFNPWLVQDPGWLTLSTLKGAIKSVLFAAPPVVEPMPDPARLREVVTNRVRAQISTGTVNRTSIFTITAASTDRARSPILANALAEIYVLNQLETKFLGTQQATEWLSRRVDDLRAQLEADESAVKALTAAADLVSAADLDARNRQAKDLRDRLVTAQATSADALDQLQQVEASTDGGASAELSKAQQDAERAEARAVAIAGTLESIEVRIAEQSLDLVELRQLQREADASRAIYEYFLARLKETSVQEGVQRADSRILSQATLPKFPTSPRKKRIVLNATALVGMLACLMVIGWEFLQKGLRTAEELEGATGYSVIGQLPVIPGATPAHVLRYLIDKPTSAAAEAVRNLRTSVVSAGPAASTSTTGTAPERQVIMVTSSVPGEGKTTQVIALAQNFAALGKRVLVIEGDIRRPALAAYFGADPTDGLLAALQDGRDPSALVVHHAASGLDVLFGGGGGSRAVDVFASGHFGALIAWARKTYDFILIDTPPVLVVPDARSIAQYADQTLYVAQWDKTSASLINEGLAMFDSLGINVAGLILTRIDPQRMRRYGLGNRAGGAAFGQAYYDS